nr:helix-turn-helix domain-containing protein [uncultured Methanobrevibacter sp.]
MENRIRELRQKNNISQMELSKITGISLEDLIAIENNQIEVTLLDANRIARALNQKFIADVFLLDELKHDF